MQKACSSNLCKKKEKNNNINDPNKTSHIILFRNSTMTTIEKKYLFENLFNINKMLTN